MAPAVIAIRVYRSFTTACSSTFSLLGVPAVGSFRICDNAGENAKLTHLAASRKAAEASLNRHGYPSAVSRNLPITELPWRYARGPRKANILNNLVL